MTGSVQAIAFDYDGTLTSTDRLDVAVLAAIRRVRSAGRTVVLVTGRILSELRTDFPGVLEEFDAVVAENGGVLADGDGVHDLTTPVDPRLAQALAHRDIPLRQGRVLLACDGKHAGAVVQEVARLELDCQVVRNRGALMVLPGGVTKGTGLVHALGNLGISRHSTVAVGDAENDHQLLDVCELGIAVANAVDSLKERADLVLEEPDGAGVVRLLDGPLVRGEQSLPPRRWQLTLGEDDDGREVHIPASNVNVLVTGASCSGKSYLLGLLVEQLVRLDYSVLVFDREGDHRLLAERRGIIAVGGRDPLPSPAHLTALLRHRFGSVIVDLSLMDDTEQRAYVSGVAAAVLTQRAVTGLPHWVFFDEAHLLPLWQGHWADALADGDRGFCFSTYQPGSLPDLVRTVVDLSVVTAEGDPDAHQAVLATGSVADATRQQHDGPARGRAVLVDAASGGPGRAFAVQHRSSGHVRHWHKYIDGQLPTALQFYFADRGGRAASNVRDFHRMLGTCDPVEIEGHARRHDFSRWIGEVLQDQELADGIEDAERQLRSGRLEPAALRDVIRAAIEVRYLERAPAGAGTQPLDVIAGS